jgi:hypothetical protein
MSGVVKTVEVKPVRVLRATALDDGWQLTVEGQDAVLGAVRGKHIFSVNDLINRNRIRAKGSAVATAGDRTWMIAAQPDHASITATDSALNSEMARLSWENRDQHKRFAFARAPIPIGTLARPGRPDLKLFISPWQNLTKQQMKSAWPDGHWSLSAGPETLMHFGFNMPSPTKIFVGMFPAAERDPDELLLALMCLHEICRFRATGHGPVIT